MSSADALAIAHAMKRIGSEIAFSGASKRGGGQFRSIDSCGVRASSWLERGRSLRVVGRAADAPDHSGLVDAHSFHDRIDVAYVCTIAIGGGTIVEVGRQEALEQQPSTGAASGQLFVLLSRVPAVQGHGELVDFG
jgi:hypothetical protein